MEAFGILMISVTMFLGSYAAGCLPLFFNLNEGRIRLASVFGAGILIGTTLCVIIPEGISAYYESNNVAHIHTGNVSKSAIDTQIKDWKETMERMQATLSNAVKNNAAMRSDLNKLLAANSALAKAETGDLSAHKIARREKPLSTNQANYLMRSKRSASKVYEDERNSGAIGLALIVGFLFLFVVDHFSKAQAAGRTKGVPTLGLIIHAAADGIAMGSASTTDDSDLPMITFFAIMIHKAPAAFALASFLLLEGLEKFRVRRHLLAFSVAAPLATIITYLFLRHMNDPTSTSSDSLGNSYNTGVILLFSGGTFLYIAASHILPELVESKCSPTTNVPIQLAGGSSRPHFSVVEVVIFVMAALLPFLLSSHHHH